VCAAPGSAALGVANLAGRDDPWLTPAQRLFVTAPTGGATALLTGYRPRLPESEPIAVEIRRIDPDRSAEGGSLVLALAPAGAADAAECPRLEALALLRGAGAVRFLDTGWVGRLGRGLWVESFALMPRGSSSPPIEYKAL